MWFIGKKLQKTTWNLQPAKRIKRVCEGISERAVHYWHWLAHDSLYGTPWAPEGQALPETMRFYVHIQILKFNFNFLIVYA